MKPASILLTRSGMAKLTDFDLVRAADTTGGTLAAPLALYLCRTGGLSNADQVGLTAVSEVIETKPAQDTDPSCQ